MPFALTFLGLLLIITGFQNTYKQFGSLVQGEFTGPNNFLYWMASVGVIGGVGYIKGLESFSRAFMALILVVLFITMYKKNPNIFSDIGSGINAGSKGTTPIGAPLAGAGGGSGGGDGGSDFGLSDIGEAASIIGDIGGFF